jgi:hypothetical protein
MDDGAAEIEEETKNSERSITQSACPHANVHCAISPPLPWRRQLKDASVMPSSDEDLQSSRTQSAAASVDRQWPK